MRKLRVYGERLGVRGLNREIERERNWWLGVERERL